MWGLEQNLLERDGLFTVLEQEVGAAEKLWPRRGDESQGKSDDGGVLHACARVSERCRELNTKGKEGRLEDTRSLKKVERLKRSQIAVKKRDVQRRRAERRFEAAGLSGFIP